jgi:hypothetical protein
MKDASREKLGRKSEKSREELEDLWRQNPLKTLGVSLLDAL